MFFHKPSTMRRNGNGNGSPVSVLLADGDATFVRTMETLFDAPTHPKITLVGAAQNGEDFLAQAQALAPMTVLVDLHLPKLGGLWTIPFLRVVFPTIGIIMLVPEYGKGYRSAVLAAGGDEVITRATMKTDLILAVERVSNKEHIESKLSPTRFSSQNHRLDQGDLCLKPKTSRCQ